MINSLFGKIYNSAILTNTRLERIWKIAQVDFKKRYYNDKFGLLWALINPLTQIVLYYFVFTKVLNRAEDNFALFLFCGIIVWLAFSQATTVGARVLIRKIHLIESVQFNWLDLFTSHIISVLLGLLFNLAAYIILLFITGAQVGEHFYLFPLILVIWFLITSAVSIILSVIRPIFEDVEHLWSIILLVGFWVSGIFFSGSYFLENYVWFAHANPFVGIILNTRACLLEGNDLYVTLFISNMIFAILIYVIALFLFKKFAKKVVEHL